MGLPTYALTIFVFCVSIAITILNSTAVFPVSYVDSADLSPQHNQVMALNIANGASNVPASTDSDPNWWETGKTIGAMILTGILNTVWIEPLCTRVGIPLVITAGVQGLIYLLYSYDVYNIVRNTNIFG